MFFLIDAKNNLMLKIISLLKYTFLISLLYLTSLSYLLIFINLYLFYKIAQYNNGFNGNTWI